MLSQHCTTTTIFLCCPFGAYDASMPSAWWYSLRPEKSKCWLHLWTSPSKRMEEGAISAESHVDRIIKPGCPAL